MNCDSASVTKPEREDADGVRRRHDQPEQRGVPRRSALADEICGDDRLAVPGRERVRRAPEERRRERARARPEAEVVVADQLAKPESATRSGACELAPLESAGGASGPSPGSSVARTLS